MCIAGLWWSQVEYSFSSTLPPTEAAPTEAQSIGAIAADIALFCRQCWGYYNYYPTTIVVRKLRTVTEFCSNCMSFCTSTDRIESTTWIQFSSTFVRVCVCWIAMLPGLAWQLVSIRRAIEHYSDKKHAINSRRSLNGWSLFEKGSEACFVE